MKLYTEEQVRKLLDKMDIIYSLEDLTPIELPSDEEIEELLFNKFKTEHSPYQFTANYYFKLGAHWMKEQILNQNK